MLISFVSVLQLSCTDYKTATNPQNHAPVIEKVDYNKTTYHNRPVTIECIAGDIDGDDLTYSWVAGDGIISGQGKSVIWTPPGRMENYPIDLTVSDGKGGEAKDRIYIMVVTNADGSGIPNIEIKLVLGDNNTAQIENQRVGSWSTADIFCTVDNATGSNLVYRWSADCGRIKEIDGQNNKLNRISWIAPGTQCDCTVNVTVTDVQDRREAKGKVMFRVFCCGKELYGE
jgi:hypothetical protein